VPLWSEGKEIPAVKEEEDDKEDRLSLLSPLRQVFGAQSRVLVRRSALVHSSPRQVHPGEFRPDLSGLASLVCLADPLILWQIPAVVVASVRGLLWM
jgi:hypothetical protein